MFNCFDVNDAFYQLVSAFHNETISLRKTDSRAGKVIQAVGPTLVRYWNPQNKVLINPARDANPFFHLYEALWMLGGRNDVASLKYYNSAIGDIASDDSKTFNGAYGYRWRNNHISKDVWEEKVDQLQILIQHLKENPNSRRAVLSMWNVDDDLLKIDNSKDVCCNTQVYFLITEGKLDMTVTNRSNDLIWGMLGANVVHFAMLQEYMAAHLEIEVGSYYQFTNNLHVYENNWKPEEWLCSHQSTPYSSGACFSICSQDMERFDEELPGFIDDPTNYKVANNFLLNVARPLLTVFKAHKQRNYKAALYHLQFVKSRDWQIAGEQWIAKRQKAWEAKHA
jgi:thymidylate synthase